MNNGNSHTKASKLSSLVVLGAGESGVGAALLGQKRGWDVFVSDVGGIKSQHKDQLDAAGIKWEEGQHSKELIFKANLVVKSPGIPDNTSIVSLIRGQEIRVISEIEFASGYTSATLIAITGTNGKTTTCCMVHHILSQAGIDAGLAGNIGKSFALQVACNDHNLYVLELSSFQLDGIEDFRPHIAVVTNITPDHLDRYPDYDSYVASKFQLIKNQTEEDFLLYDADNQSICNWLKKFPIKSKKIPFSLRRQLEIGASLKDNKLSINTENTSITMSSSSMTQKGDHHTKNAMAAATVAKLLQIRKHTIRESLESFQGVEHRLEKVLKVNNVQYINDSKATNINATYYALESMDNEVVWIAGGVDKGNDYSELFSVVNSRVKAIICLGVDNSRLLRAFDNCVDLIIESSSMQDAVSQAHRIAEKGNTVLLSPACASYDLFESYEDRGRQFKEAVKKL